jgi:hypothetical protein
MLAWQRTGQGTVLEGRDTAPKAGSTRALATTTQLGNWRLQQDEISARLARVESNDRTTLPGKCETFRLTIQIAELPRIKEHSVAATRREIIEPRNRAGFVTKQIEVTVRTYFEIAYFGAGFGQCLIGKPNCESNEPVVPFFDRPPLAVRQCPAAD